MQRVLSAAAGAVVVLALVGCLGAPSKADVRVTDAGFSPAQVSVRAGGTVEWINDSSQPHTVTTTESDSQAIEKGKTFSQEFDKAGTYDYYCRYHPTETGTVEVK
jgi:plastocyanin